MSQQTTHELAIGYGLVALSHDLSATGGWVQAEGQLIDSNLPLGDRRMAELTKTVHDMAAEYRTVGRSMKTLFFGFEDQYLAIISRGSLYLGLMFSDQVELSPDKILTVKKFLYANQDRLTSQDPTKEVIPLIIPEAEESTPKENLWPKLERELRQMMSRALNAERANHLIELTMIEYNGNEAPSASEAPELARKIIFNIPHRKKRRLLWEEFQEMFSNCYPEVNHA